MKYFIYGFFTIISFIIINSSLAFYFDITFLQVIANEILLLLGSLFASFSMRKLLDKGFSE